MSLPTWVRRVPLAAAVLAFAWFACTFLVYPNLAVVAASFDPAQGGVVEIGGDLLASRRVRDALRDTLIITIVSTVTANAVGIAQALFLEAFDLAGRRVLTIAYAIPLVFASVSAVSGYVLAYGPHSVITGAVRSVFPQVPDTWFQGMLAVIIVHTFTLTGYHFLFLRPAIRRVDYSLVEAARSLGINPVVALVRVVLPAVAPVLLSAAVLTLVASITSFAAPQILGGGEMTTIAPLIQALLGLGRPDMAALLGIVLGLVTVALLGWVLSIERRATALAGGKSPRPFRRIRLAGAPARIAVTLAAYALAVVNLLPLAMTALMSLAPAAAIRQRRLSAELTAEHYWQMLTQPEALRPVVNSLILAAIAIPAALVISWFAAHVSYRWRSSRAGDAMQLIVFAPHFLPGVLIALGLIIAFGSASPLVGGAVLVGSYIILPLAYVIFLLPVMSRFVRATYAGLDSAQEEAARSLGARNLAVFLVAVVPVVMPVLIQVSAMSLNDVFSEYTVSVMLYNVNNQPLGVTIGSLTASQDPQNAGLVSAYIVTVTVLSLVFVSVADRFAERASARQVGLSPGG